jgi:hypothetical protein
MKMIILLALALWTYPFFRPNNGFKEQPATGFIRKTLVKFLDIHFVSSFLRSGGDFNIALCQIRSQLPYFEM